MKIGEISTRPLESGLERVAGGSGASKLGVDFQEALAKAGAGVLAPQMSAAKAVEAFTRGADGNLHETLLAVDKAEISLKFLANVRNRVVDAYREIMRMGM